MNEQRLRLSAGDTVFKQGERGDAMYVIAEGAIQIYRDSSNGRVVLAELGPGDFFGEMAIVDGAQRTATASALRKSEVIVVEDSELDALIKTRPDVAEHMIRTLVQRIKNTTDKLVDEREKLGLALATERILLNGGLT